MLPFFGTYYNGAKSWFVLGPFNLQPAELAKLAVILYLAALISKKRVTSSKSSKKGLLPVLCILLFVAALIMIQPDFGSACILVGGGLVVIVSGGANLRHLFLGGMGLATLGSFFSHGPPEGSDYRLSKPMGRPSRDGLSIDPGAVCVRTRRLTGAGFGKGIQKLHYLPFPITILSLRLLGRNLALSAAPGCCSLSDPVLARYYRLLEVPRYFRYDDGRGHCRNVRDPGVH